MMVFWKARLVILANSKTGSQALEAALAPEADMVIRYPSFYRHMNVAWYEKSLRKLFLPEDKARLEVLAVIREPVDWLGSWYRYRTRPDLDGTDRSTKGVSFAAFVEGWLEETPPPFARIGRQSRFCARDDGSLGVQHLFAYEGQAALHGFLRERTGIKVRTRKVNVSPRGATDLPDTIRVRLQEESAAEFALHRRALEGSGLA